MRRGISSRRFAELGRLCTLGRMWEMRKDDFFKDAGIKEIMFEKELVEDE